MKLLCLEAIRVLRHNMMNPIMAMKRLANVAKRHGWNDIAVEVTKELGRMEKAMKEFNDYVEAKKPKPAEPGPKT